MKVGLTARCELISSDLFDQLSYGIASTGCCNMRLKTRIFICLLVCFSILFLLLTKTRSKNESVTSYHGKIHYSSYDDITDLSHHPDISTINLTPSNSYSWPGISYHPNMDIRGKWQQEQIVKFCDRYHLTDTAYSLDLDNPLKSEFYRHVIFDDRSKSLYCFIPKVGCTSARTALFVAISQLPKSVFDMLQSKPLPKMKPLLETKLEQATKKSSFLNHSLTDKSRIDRLRNYGKYAIVRHPLQRLLSAYLDKLGHPLLPKNLKKVKPLNYFQKLSHEIVKLAQPIQYAQWNNSRLVQLRPQFHDFLSWITEQDLAVVNEHFAPQFYNAEPCRVQYHFYGNFDRFHNDLSMILSKFQVNGSLLLQSLPPLKQGLSTAEQMQSYWSDIPLSLKHKIYEKFKIEFDFYHSLYPEEIKTTNQALELSVKEHWF